MIRVKIARCAVVLSVFLAGMACAPKPPLPPESLQDLLPAGETLDIPAGLQEDFVLYEGMCLGFRHEGIEFSGEGRKARLEIDLLSPDELISSIEVKLPAAAGSLRFSDFGSPAEFFTIRFRLRAQGTGVASIHSPRLLRSVSVDHLEVSWAGKQEKKPNIFFIMIDTLRKDRVGCYGSGKGLTPGIDALAGDAVLFDDAVAQSPWTRPSVASMLTGLAPYEHGVTDRDDAVPEDALLLPERLQAAGYQTYGVITNGNVCAKFGFDQGFDAFVRGGGPAKRDGSHALSIAEKLIDDRDETRPVFMYFHLSDPHAPYHPPEEFREKWAPGIDPAIASRDALRDHRNGEGLNDELRAQIQSLYDGEVAFVDHLVGEFIGHLKEQGLYDSSVILLVADHGEEFWEHGIWGHGGSLYPVLIEVPMMLKLPGQLEGVRTERLVQHIDILPTLLSLAGVAPTEELRGLNLIDSEMPENRIVFSSVDKAGLAGIAATTRRWKMIEARSGLFTDTHGALRFFDRKNDPGEMRDLSGENPQALGMLKEILDRELRTARKGNSSKVHIRGALRQELEALGYIEAGEKLQESAN